MPTLDMPRESILIDYMSFIPSTKQGNDYVFVFFDWFSKLVIMTAYKNNIIAEATSKLLFEWVWVHFGIPETIILN